MSQRVFVRNLGGTPIVLDVAESSDGVTDGDKGDITVSGGGTVWTIDDDVIREKLTAARSYYVRTDGSDSNTGLVNNAGGAFLTMQKAMNVITTIDTGGFDVVIQLADGTYSDALVIKPWIGGGTIYLQGNTGDKTAVVLSNNYTVSVGSSFIGTFTIVFVTFTGTTINIDNIGGTGLISFYNVKFSGAAIYHVRCQYPGALIQALTNYEIAAGAAIHWAAFAGGSISTSSAFTITLTGTPAFTLFAQATNGTVGPVASLTFSGAATGTRYLSSVNGVIDTGGGGANYLPGNVAGSTATGGQYV